MKKSISTLLFYFISVSLFSQKVYTPDWESLDKRPGIILCAGMVA